MDNSITFTPGELVSIILAICAAIITISAAIGVITKAIDKTRSPEREQNNRLGAIEHRLDEIDKTIITFREYFTNDDNRFKAIEKSNKVTQSALLALLKHSLNGQDIEALKQAEKTLEDYLIEK